MLLLLAGAQDTARALVADAFLGDHPEWKHLALEDVWDPAEGDAPDAGSLYFSMLVACQALRDTLEEGARDVLITCPAPELLETLEQQFSGELTYVHIGEDSAWGGIAFDHVLSDTGQSVRDVSERLHTIAAT